MSQEQDEWFNEVDAEIINYKEDNNDDILSNKENIQNEVEKICIEDILEKNIENLNSNKIIQYESMLAYYVQVLLENTIMNKLKIQNNINFNEEFDKFNDIINYLTWISKSSEFLCKKIGQEIVHHIPDKQPIIVRSSYNFCTKNTQCKNFYNKDEIPTCKEHHYVHTLLKYDVDSIINYLSYIINNNINLSKDDINNIYVSIKTICYVARHMSKEINCIDHITNNNSEFFHRNNPIQSIRKNIAKSNIKILNKEQIPIKINNKKKIKNKNPQNNFVDNNIYSILSNI